MFAIEVMSLLARAGGGGSSSSGGSGGGGIFALPAVVAAGVAGFVRSKTGSKAAGVAVGMAAGTAVSLLYLWGGKFAFIVAMISTVIGAFGGAWADKLGRFRKGSAAAQRSVQQAAASDAAWSPERLIEYAASIFGKFQRDWQQMDVASIRAYTTQRYANHISLMLYALQQMGRANRISNIRIKEVIITSAHDDANDQQDRVSFGILAQANDQLIDTASGDVLTATTEEFGEQWNFVRHENTWLLDSIDQATEEESMLVRSLRQFAADNRMYFSPDWGNLLLPTRGQLFKAGFKNADINNHIIGFWTGDLLVQLYTYRTKEDESGDQYVVGQINLPKSYGGILVERRGKLLSRLKAPRGYNKVSLEWGDFNKRYQVYATDENQVTSFELLNPSFMAWLYDQDIKVNIEVVDDVVYLYAKLSANEQRYEAMLEILKRSHKELKM
jgi:hypothetical protein